jgi:hypothetical protein
VVQKYLEYGEVCPSVVEKGVFMTSDIVNIDHNPSLTTAMLSFQGRGICFSTTL